MGETYSWHPEFDIAGALWPRARNVLPDELLSSWLIRNAFAHGCSPMSLTGSLWPSWRCWTVDLDRGLSTQQMSPLARLSGVSDEHISLCTLQPISHVLNPGIGTTKGVWPWILTRGFSNRRPIGGLQCCPFCFSEGVPYYRISSRLAWHTCCEKHLSALIDSCPACGASLQPHMLEQEGPDCGHCHRCKKRLDAEIGGLGFAAGALAFQRAADDALRGKGREGAFSCDPYDWFYRARFVLGILRVSATSGSKTFSAFRRIFNIGAVARPISGLPLEMLPVRDRMDLLAAAWKIMETGEGQIEEAILASSIPRKSLMVPAGEITVRVKSLLDRLPVGATRKRSSPGERSPASKRTVEKLWARLKRKVWRDG
ncbi:TniQ family protein [Pseudomonas sp. S2_H01]